LGYKFLNINIGLLKDLTFSDLAVVMVETTIRLSIIFQTFFSYDGQ